MAKGKHAAALFEVIHADRRFGKKTEPSRAFLTPKWWFKGKQKTAQAAPSQLPPPPAAAERIDSPAALETILIPSTDTRSRSLEPAHTPTYAGMNPARQGLSLRLTPRSAIAGGCALLVVLSVTYVIGRNMRRGPANAVAAAGSTQALRKSAPKPGVMDLAKAQRDGESSIAPEGDESAHVMEETPAAISVATLPAAQRFDGNRVNNQHYVVVQSWPAQDKLQADEAAKLLNEAGIGATVVQGAPGWPSTWYSVVGTMPFDRTKSNPVYTAYRQSIMNVSAKYAGKTKWKRFEPTAVKWTGG